MDGRPFFVHQEMPATTPDHLPYFFSKMLAPIFYLFYRKKIL